MNLADLRQNYLKGALSEVAVQADPLEQFKIWFKEAQNAQVVEPNAMVLSTLSSDARIRSRVVLLKSIGAGFSFFTNHHSHKGQELLAHAQASLCFFWDVLERQVRIEGKVLALDDALAADYFAQRPRESQLGAWTSQQSAVLSGREELEAQYQHWEKEFEGKSIPKPPHWGGYELIPDYIEFWQGRPSRLHDRIVYRLQEGQWIIERLAP